jgi:NCS1 family nucleobase:cation symporter-1
MYYFAYVIGIVISGGVYWALCSYWPVSVQFSLETWMEIGDYEREDEREHAEGTVDDIAGGRDDLEMGDTDGDMKEKKIMRTQIMVVAE